MTISVGGQTWTAAINNGTYTRTVDSQTAAGSYTVSSSADDGVGHAGACSSTVTVKTMERLRAMVLAAFLPVRTLTLPRRILTAVRRMRLEVLRPRFTRGSN